LVSSSLTDFGLSSAINLEGREAVRMKGGL